MSHNGVIAMKYMGTMLAVTDMEKSKSFYRDVLRLKVTSDTGINVTLNGAVALQTLDTWTKFTRSNYVMFDNHAVELYFETAEFDSIVRGLDSYGAEYLHEPMVRVWGQRFVRFYDPDKHIIEVAEAIEIVVRRFAAEGMTEEQIAERMKLDIDFIRRCLNED